MKHQGEPMEVYVHESWTRNSIGFHLVSRHDGRVFVARPLDLADVTESPASARDEATVYLRREECQGLVDALWRAGIRPSEGTGSAGSLAQAEAHIDSLRKIAFKLSGVS